MWFLFPAGVDWKLLFKPRPKFLWDKVSLQVSADGKAAGTWKSATRTISAEVLNVWSLASKILAREGGVIAGHRSSFNVTVTTLSVGAAALCDGVSLQCRRPRGRFYEINSQRSH
jgi:hypothetical protein